MKPSVPPGEVRRFGDRALLIGARDAPAARALGAELGTQLRGTDAEVVCGFATVAAVVRDPFVDLADVESAAGRAVHAVAALRRESAAGGVPGHGGGRIVTIPCTFDGPDLNEVAERAGCTSSEVVELLTAQPLTVAVVGFSPGFAYLDGLPDALRAVARRTRPRPVVPAGAVALANGHAAVYPTASPGGWQLVGRTGFPLFSVSAPPYAALAPGDRVRFRVARTGDPAEPLPLAPPAWAPPADSRLVCEVVTPGWRAVVQDGGRSGVAALGIPYAGPSDPVSFALANALTGNPPGAGALEITGGGTRLRGLEPSHVAVVGAAPEVRLDGAPVPAERVLPFEPGQVLEVGRLRDGCRTYVAVAGGVLGPELFGSCARDELSGLGPGALAPGARLFAGRWSPPLGDHLSEGAALTARAGGTPVELRVVPGPHQERFEAGALERLAESVFAAEGDSNRVGVRLRREDGAAWRGAGEADGELDSQGMVTGAIQVPPGGDPVVLGPDHATLGGYAVVAVVASADHGRLGQCGPGTRVRFVPVTQDEADSARRVQRRTLERAVVGTSPLPAL
jgi:KipI family sensor histidine kinase inhibitor